MKQHTLKLTLVSLLLSAACSLSACSGQTNSSNSSSTSSQADSQGSSSSSSSSSASTEVSADSNLTAPGEYPIVREKVTLKVFTTPSLKVEDMSTNDATKWMEEKTNVHIDWSVATSQDGGEKITLMIASNSGLPDVIMSKALTAEQIAAYGGEGFFLPINDLIDKWGVNMKKVNEYNPRYFNMISAADGNIYGIAEHGGCYHCSYPQKMWMNQSWMDRLGLTVPTTTEEFYTVLKAFKDQDANGNGDPNDEIPMVATVDGNQNQVDSFLMNSFIFNPTYKNTYLLLDNGTVDFVANKEEFREGLRYIKRLYSEGLIDKECFINKQEQLKVLLSDPSGNRVGSYSQLAVDRGVEVCRTEYVAIAPLKGPDGTQIAPKASSSLKPTYMITKDCTMPEVAFRWGDTFQTDGTSLLANGDYSFLEFTQGPEGKAWRRAEEGEIGISGGKAVQKWIVDWSATQNWHWDGIQPHFTRPEGKGMMVYDPEAGFDQEKVLWDATRDLYEPYGQDKNVPGISYFKEEASELSGLKAAIVEYTKENITKFVTGTADLDTDWEKYTKELEGIGLSRMLEIVQTAYDRQYK